MTDIELLPLPSVLLNWPHPTNHVAIRDYARAVAEHNVAAKDADIEALRAEVDEARGLVIEANNSLYGSQGYFHSLNGGAYDRHHLSRGIEDLKTSSRARYAAEARAERLEEALREIERLMPDQAGPAWIAKTIASAALRDHDKEGKDG